MRDRRIVIGGLIGGMAMALIYLLYERIERTEPLTNAVAENSQPPAEASASKRSGPKWTTVETKMTEGQFLSQMKGLTNKEAMALLEAHQGRLISGKKPPDIAGRWAPQTSDGIRELPTNGDAASRGYISGSGNRYKYDLSSPADRNLYGVDPAAQNMDAIDPRVRMDRSMGYYGGGITDR